jgi:hypothetical protein
MIGIYLKSCIDSVKLLFVFVGTHVSHRAGFNFPDKKLLVFCDKG